MQSFLLRGYSGSYAWKPGFQELLRPCVRWLAAHGARANTVSAVALILSAAAGLLLLVFGGRPGVWLCLPGVLLLRMSLNAMDGMLAREHDQRSPAGMYWNELGDVASDAFLLAPFSIVEGVSPWAMAGVAVLIALAEMAGVLGLATAGKRCYGGLLGKSDRALLLGALSLWIGVTGGLPLWMSHAFPVMMAVLLVATVLTRVREGAAKGGYDACR